MKILIIQLTRLGDILQTAPTINALQRKYPEAKIDLLVRSRFKEACSVLTNLNAVWVFDSKQILQPLAQYPLQLESSMNAIRAFVEGIKGESYDKIVNLSFSPLSSFLLYQLQNATAEYVGYTRHDDGFLMAKDDASAYFYGQVGVGKSNRIHVADLFAQVAGVELQPDDWKVSDAQHGFQLPPQYIVVHVGASEKHKRFGQKAWQKTIDDLTRTLMPIVLIGSKDELKIADGICGDMRNENLINLVGETSIADSFAVISNAALVIGADSAPIHIASLTHTPVLNLSGSTVNFWETGPRSPRSRVLIRPNLNDISSEEIVQEVKNIFGSLDSLSTVAYLEQGVPSYRTNFSLSDEFEWQLIKALYMGAELPVITDNTTLVAFQQLQEVNDIIIQQIEFILNKSNKGTFSQIIDRAEEIIFGIAKMAPTVAPLIQWYEVEKTRIPPTSLEDIAERTLKICQGLQHVLSLYLGSMTDIQGRYRHENYAMEGITSTK